LSVSNLFKPGGLTWRPDANSINAPEGTLLRADNMVPDEDGALSVRRGSRVLYTFPLGTEDVHSLYTYEGADGYTYRMMGVDDQVYKNPGPGNHTAIWERQYGQDAEKIVNGLFTTDIVGWTAGAGWAWEAATTSVRHTAGNTAALTQSLNVVSGTTYHYEIEFIGTTAGTVVVTLGSVTLTAATGATGTVRGDVTAAATGFVTFAITPVTTFNGAVGSVSLITSGDDASSFQFLTQVNYTGGSWEKTYAATGDVGPVPYTATWEDAYIGSLLTTLEPVNFNVDFDGTGDIAFGDDHQQCFMARGTTNKKFDGKSFMNWGIAKPNAPAVLTSITATESSIISCATGEADGEVSAYPIVPGAVVGYWPNTIGGADGTTALASAAYAPDKLGAANQAIRITPGRAWSMIVGVLYKYFTDFPAYNHPKDLSGTDDDIFSVDVYIEDPDNCEFISIMLTVAPDDAAYFAYSWNPSQGVEAAVRSTTADGADAYAAKVGTILDPIDPKDKPRVNTPEDVKGIIASVGDQNAPSSETTAVPVGTWLRLSVSRKNMTQVGAIPTGYGWNTVSWARLEFVNKNGSLAGVHFSDFALNSSDEGTLTGDYKVVYRWMRDTDRYYETSPPSDESNEITLAANQLRVTIPAAAQNGADDQVTDCWVYLFGGFLDTYYRVGVATADPQLTTDLVIDLTKNEVSILTENERLEPYVDVPRDNIISIAGPWNGRLFTLTSEGYVYPSLQTSPSTFNTYQVIDLSNQGDPLWMVKTSSGIHCGCERDAIFLAGTGDEDADRVVIDLYPHPLNIGTPPVDKGVFVDGNSILYRSTDGLIMLASQGLTHVPDDGMRLLWRGQDRHGVSALNCLTGRFRMTVDNKLMFVLAPEGAVAGEGTTTVYRLALSGGQWSRLIYPDPLLSIFNDPNGTTIAGTNNGKLLELEYGTGDAASDPSVTIWTPFSDGGNPLVRKDAFDLQLHTDSNGNTGTVEIWKDGGASASTSYSFSTSQPQAYRIQANGLGTFIRAQLKITGTFDEFQLSNIDLTYRVRAQHMTYLDTGYFQGDDPSDVIWLQEVEVDANSPSDLSVLVYLDDALFTTEAVTVTANVRTVYRVPLPRGAKSRRPRIVLKTTAADGAGEIGFDPYFVRVRTRSSGNQAQAGFRTVWPAGNAP
jgi:hypothetical protein